MPMEWLARHKSSHVILFVALVLLFATFPLTGHSDPLDLSLNLLSLGAMVAAVRAGIERQSLIWSAVALAVLGQALFTAGSIHQVAWIAALGLICRFFFFTVAILGIARGILRADRVTMNIVFGACNVYFLMAVSWGSLYILLELLWPGSFNSSHGPITMTGTQPAGELFYFSMITLTTVGYGDITPATLLAGTLAALEGFIGQLYLAIVVARLVAMELAARRPQGS